MSEHGTARKGTSLAEAWMMDCRIAEARADRLATALKLISGENLTAIEMRHAAIAALRKDTGK